MKEAITATNAPKALGPYSHAVKIEGMLFTSGQIGIDPSTGALVDGIEAQTTQALNNLKTVLAAGGASVEDVVKTTVFVADLRDFATVNKLYGETFQANYPARSCVQAAALPAGALVEIEAMAFLSADESYSF